MKKILLSSVFCGCVALIPQYTHASPVTTSIADTYWGGSGQDVVLDEEEYQITSMNVTLDGTALTVKIYSLDQFNNYFNSGILEQGLGDLFLSTNDGWTPLGTGPEHDADYTNDPGKTSNGSTTWEWAVVLNEDGSASLYSTEDGTYHYYLEDDLDSQAFLAGRYNQVTDFIADEDANPLTTGAWTIGNTFGDQTTAYWNTLTITIDLAQTDWLPTKDLGLHWTMACANDVIEGVHPGTPVPEPSTLLLFGFGLTSLAAAGRAKSRK